MAELVQMYRMTREAERLPIRRSFASDAEGSVPLRIAPLLILGLSVLVLAIMYMTTV